MDQDVVFLQGVLHLVEPPYFDMPVYQTRDCILVVAVVEHVGDGEFFAGERTDM